MPYIVSTMSAPVEYVFYDKDLDARQKNARLAKTKHTIRINGGANVQNKIETPEGVVTHVSDSDLDLLNSHKLFQKHVTGGYIKTLASEKPAKKVAKDMKDRDSSAPLNIAKGDFDKGGRAAGPAPKENKVT